MHCSEHNRDQISNKEEISVKTIHTHIDEIK